MSVIIEALGMLRYADRVLCSHTHIVLHTVYTHTYILSLQLSIKQDKDKSSIKEKGGMEVLSTLYTLHLYKGCPITLADRYYWLDISIIM